MALHQTHLKCRTDVRYADTSEKLFVNHFTLVLEFVGRAAGTARQVQCTLGYLVSCCCTIAGNIGRSTNSLNNNSNKRIKDPALRSNDFFSCSLSMPLVTRGRQCQRPRVVSGCPMAALETIYDMFLPQAQGPRDAQNQRDGAGLVH